jgi:transcriptional regulator with XRE-family HTH domain
MDRADRRTEINLIRVGGELRTARHIAGLTLAQVARVVHVSTTELSRIERGKAPWVTIGTLNRFAAAVGLDLWAKTYPGGEPLRDIAHLRLTDAFRALLGHELVVRAEVPIGDPRDLRAWDLTLTEPTGRVCGAELETRLLDAQDQLRRLHRKIAAGDLDRVLLVIADTPANRASVQVASGLLSTTFAINDPAAYEALAQGRIPPRDALILVRVGGPVSTRGVPRSPDTPVRTNPACHAVGRQQVDVENPASCIPAATRHSQRAISAVREKC